MMIKYQKIESTVLFIYLICYSFRLFEYFVLRTDQTFWNEAFIHKLVGIAIMYVVLKLFQLNWQEIGFTKKSILQNLWNGLLLGIFVFVLAYGAEILLLLSQDKFHGLDIYVSAYAVDKNIGRETGLVFFGICFLGNVINVIMEEGIFRGLFQKLFERKYSFMTAAVLSMFLFGLWHLAGPLRSFVDGDMNSLGFIVNGLILFVTSAIVGFKFALMTKLTGSLYMAIANHFANDFLVNTIHTISDTGADELMFIRIAIAQMISFIIVLFWYSISQKGKGKRGLQ